MGRAAYQLVVFHNDVSFQLVGEWGCLILAGRGEYHADDSAAAQFCARCELFRSACTHVRCRSSFLYRSRGDAIIFRFSLFCSLRGHGSVLVVVAYHPARNVVGVLLTHKVDSGVLPLEVIAPFPHD